LTPVIGGAVPETQQAWLSFLAKDYPDVKFGKEEPKF
jgi:hypothetical protein